MKISGVLEVKLNPQASYADGLGDAKLARMLIDKVYSGELSATGKGEMLSATTGVEGSAGYVAVEQVEGSLVGKKGSFVLQHSGSMSKGVSSLDLSVFPDSGAGELKGLSGSMSIKIDNGQHFYEFDFEFIAD